MRSHNDLEMREVNQAIGYHPIGSGGAGQDRLPQYRGYNTRDARLLPSRCAKGERGTGKRGKGERYAPVSSSRIHSVSGEAGACAGVST